MSRRRGLPVAAGVFLTLSLGCWWGDSFDDSDSYAPPPTAEPEPTLGRMSWVYRCPSERACTIAVEVAGAAAPLADVEIVHTGSPQFVCGASRDLWCGGWREQHTAPVTQVGGRDFPSARGRTLTVVQLPAEQITDQSTLFGAQTLAEITIYLGIYGTDGAMLACYVGGHTPEVYADRGCIVTTAD